MRRREGRRMWMDIHLPLPLFFLGGEGACEGLLLSLLFGGLFAPPIATHM